MKFALGLRNELQVYNSEIAQGDQLWGPRPSSQDCRTELARDGFEDEVAYDDSSENLRYGPRFQDCVLYKLDNKIDINVCIWP